MVFVLLIRFYRITLKYRPQYRKWFKSEYGYEQKSVFDSNYLKALFTSKEEFMRKYRRDFIINLILFALFVILAGILSDL